MTYVAGFATHATYGRVRDFSLRWDTNYAIAVNDRGTVALLHAMGFTVGISGPVGSLGSLASMPVGSTVRGRLGFSSDVDEYAFRVMGSASDLRGGGRQSFEVVRQGYVYGLATTIRHTLNIDYVN